MVERIKKIIRGRVFIGAMWVIPFLLLGFLKNILVLKIIVAILGINAVRELANLNRKSRINTTLIGLYIFSFIYLYNYQINITNFNTNFTVMAIALVFILNMLFNELTLKEVTFYLVFTFIIGYGLNTMIRVYENDQYIWLYYLATVWIFDVMSLVFGKTFGKTPLIKISPSKTIEGLVGGAISTIIIMVIIYVIASYLKIPISMSGLKLLSIVPLVCASAFVGDLLFSMVKRDVQIKDFSETLGSHGGVLDRIDSQLLAFITISILV